MPVVKLFMPAVGWRWLLTELKPDNPNIAWGLADMRMGSPEMGYIHLDEIATLRVGNLPVERDLHIELDSPLTAYWKQWRAEAAAAG